MSLLSKLRFVTGISRAPGAVDPLARAKQKFLASLEEQERLHANEGEAGRRWWFSKAGKQYLAVRYGQGSLYEDGRVIELRPSETVPSALASLRKAVESGELDDDLLAVSDRRGAALRARKAMDHAAAASGGGQQRRRPRG